MENFKRFLTYINSYTRGELIRNVGSSKIELRDNTCRITVNAKDLMNINIEDVYLFRRENNNMIVTYLGKLQYSNGNYELRVETKADDVIDTGYGFQDFAGILLLKEKNVEIIEKPQQIYAGIWDNKPLGNIISKKPVLTNNAREVTYKGEEAARGIDKTRVGKHEPENSSKADYESKEGILSKIGNLVSSKKDKVVIASTDSKKEEVIWNRGDISGQSMKDDNLDYFDAINDEIKASYMEESKENAESSKAMNKEPRKKESLQKESLQKESLQKGSLQKGSQQKENLKGHNVDNEKIESVEQISANRVEGNNKENIEADNMRSSVIDQDFVQLKNTVEIIESGTSKETIIGNADTVACIDDKLDCMDVRMAKVEELREKLKGEKKKEVTEAEKKVQYLLNVYPKMDPFDDKAECVRIEPQDLYGMSLNIWMPVNNNFLKNGYTKFKHLVLIKNGKDYVVGVPGINNEKEQFLAYLHGFTSFKPIKKLENITEEFGYWTVKIHV